MIVVDASVIVDLLLQGPDSAKLADRLLNPTQILNAPQLLDIEVAQVLRRYAAIGDLSAERGRAAIDDLSALPIERWGHELLLRRIWDHRNNLSAYDATYLALAEALDCGVWTRDSRFARSPATAGRVRTI
jgi:predicted nucleic acid-binding protein